MNKEDTTEITIENLLSKVRYYYPKDEGIIKKAFDLAFSAHDGQFRASGRPYITHPTVVADILVDLGLDVPAICAALLHDTVEDTDVTDEKIRTEFGDEIADLVKGVTKLDKLQFNSAEEEQAENIRKMFFYTKQRSLEALAGHFLTGDCFQGALFFFLFFLFPSFPFLLTGTSEVYKFKSGKGTLHVFCLDKFLETAYQIADAHPAFFHEFVLSLNAAFIVITV